MQLERRVPVLQEDSITESLRSMDRHSCTITTLIILDIHRVNTTYHLLHNLIEVVQDIPLITTVYHLLNLDREDVVALLLQDTEDLVLLDSTLLKIILHNSQEEEEDHLAKDRGLFQDLVIMHHTHTKVDLREANKVLRCNLNGDSKDLRCSSRGSKGDGLQCNSHRSSNNKGPMDSNILLTTSSSNSHLDRASLSSNNNNSRDPTVRRIIPLGTSKP
mmetsp:Transcript_18505/g.31462  ORF Transcript_18505/g.31462 Transcript_18505/m.31462 type:complete len:218 (+) Transcript_18505:316-969(+)